MQDFFGILSNFGFPVAVASYLLFRFEKKIEDGVRTNEVLVEEIKALKLEMVDLKNALKEVVALKNKILELNKIIVKLSKKRI